MTDDFHLFDTDGAVDADIALVAAYLSRELSLVQIIAVRERLATDAAFREKVQPIIDGWTYPGSADANAARLATSRATNTTSLSTGEIAAGWQRYMANSAIQSLPAASNAQRPRRVSMARIAAVIAVIVIPVVTVAQVVAYIARREPPPAPLPAAIATPRVDDAPRGRQLDVTPAQPTAESRQLPASLTDAQFRALIASVTERGSLMDGNGFTSNENWVSRAAAVVTNRGVTGGVYLGIGPEQNYTYIAASRPQLAFLLDIRRQAVVQHLMYKALFELAPDRADFVSLLFARPRPAGLNASTSIDEMLRSYSPVAKDTARARQTLGRIEDQLTRAHGIALDATDAALLRFVYAAFVSIGPTIRDHPTDTVASVLAERWSDRTVSLVVEARDGVTGAPVVAAIGLVEVGYAFGTLNLTDVAGRVRFPPYPVGGRVRVHAWGRGYDTARVEESLDKQRPVLTISLPRNARCQLDAAGRRCTSPENRPVSAQGDTLSTFYQGRTFIAMTASVDTANQPRSFLATEDNYRYVRSMHQRNLIVPVSGDLAGPHAIRRIGQYTAERGATVSMLYVSDALAYLSAPGTNSFWDRGAYPGTANAFWENAATLPTSPTSILLNTGRLCPMASTVPAMRGAGSHAAYTRAWGEVAAARCARIP